VSATISISKSPNDQVVDFSSNPTYPKPQSHIHVLNSRQSEHRYRSGGYTCTIIVEDGDDHKKLRAKNPEGIFPVSRHRLKLSKSIFATDVNQNTMKVTFIGNQ
jgi:hypothetical protein